MSAEQCADRRSSDAVTDVQGRAAANPVSIQLEHAIGYARRGMVVLPLHRPVWHEGAYRCSCGRRDCVSPAKHPFGHFVPNGLQNASKDPDVIRGWFQQARLNVGIATGAISGIIVLDVDPRHDGDATLAALAREHGPLPHTWRFLTGGGGEHILFRHPGCAIPNSAGRIGPGVVKGGVIVYRRGGAIVSTTSIPEPDRSFPRPALFTTLGLGSLFDADHPEPGVLLARRFTKIGVLF